LTYIYLILRALTDLLLFQPTLVSPLNTRISSCVATNFSLVITFSYHALFAHSVCACSFIMSFTRLSSLSPHALQAQSRFSVTLSVQIRGHESLSPTGLPPLPPPYICISSTHAPYIVRSGRYGQRMAW
jgi:hypothetical protein